MRSSKEIIEVIKNLREQKKISVEELAGRVGVAKSTLSRYENLQRDFPINDIALYANALGTDIGYLLGINIMNNGNNTDTRIPVVGSICAGDGFLAEQNIEEYIQYPFPSKRQPDFALRVKGNSMIGAGIEDGDIVYMRRAPWAEHNGQIVAALVEGEKGTLKRLRWENDSNKVRLSPENESFTDIEAYPNQVIVCGLYMGHFKPEREHV
ncbi:LexA family transcriptional regulator [Cohnella sp. AR92]|uniref:LexA family protein n=1 Tax=Cohnella sp. AR92 TaxID=648716 RepID=UPI000F8F326B|nr:LexA family transcriptional regulator [Cohnella sp. AR92]RUS42254.1 XRE family transcriptional regulator [Cohnella sp. AR92]